MSKKTVIIFAVALVVVSMVVLGINMNNPKAKETMVVMLDGTQVSDGVIVENIPMVASSDFNIEDADGYSTFEELANAGYEVKYENDKVIVTKKEIEPEIKPEPEVKPQPESKPEVESESSTPEPTPTPVPESSPVSEPTPVPESSKPQVITKPSKPEPTPEVKPEPEPEAEPEPESKPEPSKPVEDFDNTSGEGYVTDAGVLRDIPGLERPTLNSSISISDNRNNINGYLFDAYSLRYFSSGLAVNRDDNGSIAKLKKHPDDGRFGVEVFQWRRNYDSMNHINRGLNAVLDTFYIICGDREVAYALWSLVDNIYINGYSNSDDFGFHDITQNGENWVIGMNDVEIERVDGKTLTFWFN